VPTPSPTTPTPPPPTPPPLALLPAPILIEPQPGSTLDSPTITLHWEWTHELASDQWFVVSIHALGCAGEQSQWPQDRTERVQVNQLEAPLGMRGCNYAWKVVVMREGTDGTLVEISEPSEEWSFWWVWPKESPTPIH